MKNELPNYLIAARLVPLAKRAAWNMNSAPAYAGTRFTVLFWQDVLSGEGTLGGSLVTTNMVPCPALVVGANQMGNVGGNIR